MGILYEIIKPAKILPRAKRLMGFMRVGLFSLRRISGEYRGFVMRAKKMIRKL